MPLARAPMLFVTVAQEKRDFKIFVILITAWSRVQVLAGPPKKHEISVSCFSFAADPAFCRKLHQIPPFAQ